MSKRNERENRSSSSSSQQPPSPKRNRRSSSTVMEDSRQSEALSLEQFNQIMDKLSRLDTQMQEHFGKPDIRNFNLETRNETRIWWCEKVPERRRKISRGGLGFNQRHLRRNKNPQRLQENMPTKPRLPSPRTKPAQSKPQKSWQPTSWNRKFENKAAWRTGENYCFGDLF